MVMPTKLNSRRLFCAAISISLVGAAMPAAVRAQPADAVMAEWVSMPNGRLRVIAGGAPPSADGRLYVGVEIQLAPGWKTYWRMPGDAGIPPSFDWAKSTNIDPKAVEILFPAPKRMADAGGDLVGYTGSVTFVGVLKPLSAAAPINIAVDVQLGICREQCIPVETTLTLAVPPQRTGSAPPDAIVRAVELAPRTADQRRALDPELLTITGTVTEPKGRLVITARRATDLFIEAPESIFVPLPTKLAVQPTGTDPVTFTIDLAQAPDIKDVLGKPLRITMVGPGGASEMTWVAK